MPVLAAVAGAVMTGLLYWFMYGNGMKQIGQLFRDRRNDRVARKERCAISVG